WRDRDGTADTADPSRLVCGGRDGVAGANGRAGPGRPVRPTRPGNPGGVPDGHGQAGSTRGVQPSGRPARPPLEVGAPAGPPVGVVAGDHPGAATGVAAALG